MQQLLLQVNDLPGGFQPKVAALDGAPRQMGQIPHHRQTGLGFQHRAQRFVQGFRAIIEQNAHDMAGRAELQKPLQLGSKGDACPFGLYH